MPKSVMTTRPSRPSSTLSGLRSRCTTPAACAAASPAQMALAIVRTSSTGRRPLAPSFAASDSPSTNSMVRNFSPSLLADVVDARHVAVRDAARELGLLAEPVEDPRLVEHVAAQHLEGHHLVELGISGPVDGAHATRADQARGSRSARQVRAGPGSTMLRPTGQGAPGRGPMPRGWWRSNRQASSLARRRGSPRRSPRCR